MSERDLEECGNPEGDGCVVNYGGTPREYWCKHADENTIRVQNGAVWVYCDKLHRRVKVING